MINSIWSEQNEKPESGRGQQSKPHNLQRRLLPRRHRTRPPSLRVSPALYILLHHLVPRLTIQTRRWRRRKKKKKKQQQRSSNRPRTSSDLTSRRRRKRRSQRTTKEPQLRGASDMVAGCPRLSADKRRKTGDRRRRKFARPERANDCYMER